MILTVGAVLVRPQQPEADKQREQHVARRAPQKRVGNLRDAGEQRQSGCIAFEIRRVNKPLG